MHFFLEGESGIGKSFLLQEALKGKAVNLAGFMVQRLYENGGVVGFRAYKLEGELLPLDRAYDPKESGIFLSPSGKDISALEEVITRVEEDCRRPDCKVIMLDEIGGVELTSHIFMDALKNILSCGKPCVGVLKSRANLTRTLANYGGDEDYRKKHSELKEIITENGKLYTVLENNKGEISRKLGEFVAGV